MCCKSTHSMPGMLLHGEVHVHAAPCPRHMQDPRTTVSVWCEFCRQDNRPGSLTLILAVPLKATWMSSSGSSSFESRVGRDMSSLSAQGLNMPRTLPACASFRAQTCTPQVALIPLSRISGFPSRPTGSREGKNGAMGKTIVLDQP